MLTPEASLLSLLGAPALRADGAAVAFLPERRYQLLALLGLRSGEWVERDRIAQLFWPEHPLAEARRNLRKVIFRARDVPGVQGLQVKDHALCWTVATDVQAFGQALREGRHGDAVAMLVAPPLSGLEDPSDTAWADWLGAERTRLTAAWQEAAHTLLRQTADDPPRLALAQRLLAADPLDETALAAVIDSELARGNMAAARRAYIGYAERLAAELGIEPSNALRERWRAAVAAASGAPPPPGAAAAPAANAAPAAASSAAADFIGRRSELAELDALLALPELRLLTLLGPGGVGKSRLARQVQARCARHFVAGTWWVDLQDLQDLAALTARLAQLLGVEINDTHDPLATACRTLQEPAGGGRALLVLDNAEHLQGLPAWVDRMLVLAPSATLLVTSRVRLQCLAERPVPLGGLAAPDEESRDLEAAMAFDAVRLFEACARRALPGFELAAHLGSVLEVIDAVGGLPLAIELAASWVRLLPPPEIASELRQSVDVLQRDPALPGSAARPEHDSLGATLEGSWRLLAPRERAALAALAVFEGGFTRAAAQAVAQASLPLLASLFDRSLLQADEDGRFSMHPYAAAWARCKLEAEPARALAVRDAHTVHFARWLDGLAVLSTSAPRQVIEQMRNEQGNWTQAWRRALATGIWDAVRQMLPPLRIYFETQGRWNEGLALLQPALAAPDAGQGGDAGARARTHALGAVATLQYRRGDLRQAEDNAAAAAGLAQRLGETEIELNSLNTLGLSLWHQGRSAQALPHLQQALARARERGRQRELARSLSTLAIAEKSLGHYAVAMERQVEVLALQRALGDVDGLCKALNNVGNLHRVQGRFREALPCFEEGLRLATEHGLDANRTFQALNLGLSLRELAELPRARQVLTLALDAARHTSQPVAELPALLGLASCDIAERNFDAGLQHLRAAMALAEARAMQAYVLETLAVYASLRQEQGDRPQAAALWVFISEQASVDEGVRVEARRNLATAAPDAAALLAARAWAARLNLAQAGALLRHN